MESRAADARALVHRPALECNGRPAQGGRNNVRILVVDRNRRRDQSSWQAPCGGFGGGCRSGRCDPPWWLAQPVGVSSPLSPGPPVSNAARSLSGPGQGVFCPRARSRPPYPAPACRPVVIAGKRELVSSSGAFLERLLAVAFEHQLRCPPVGVSCLSWAPRVRTGCQRDEAKRWRLRFTEETGTWHKKVAGFSWCT
jgi:hypothetical protein